MIEEYKFGFIIINGEKYEHDVQVFWTGEVLKWWRKASHNVELDDLKEALEINPEIVIIGKGQPGEMEVSDEVKKKLKEKNIELIIDGTEEAVKTFNVLVSQAEEDEEERQIIGLFHLTC